LFTFRCGYHQVSVVRYSVEFSFRQPYRDDRGARWTVGNDRKASTHCHPADVPPARDYVIAFLDTLATNKRMVRTTPTETMMAMTLITLQCFRRFYETWFMQVFSSKLKITHQ
uniref:Uncharacterized protein n=1 Tax=Anopheles coluzzii TaxID=1518534 RepID=A0A8W7PVM0_ANOCL